MNIFFLSADPNRAARWHCDKHVVKMILETTQLLYTAHWVLGKSPEFHHAPKALNGNHGYISIRNPRHPCALWVRESLLHYQWLVALGLALCAEYRHRFPAAQKGHSCEQHLHWLRRHPPPSLKSLGWRDPPKAMPDQYKRHGDSIVCYRIYYRESKGDDRGMLTYSRRHVPHWVSARPAAPPPA